VIQQALTHASCYKIPIPDSNFPEEPQKAIHSAPNAARRQMNSFVIEVGTYVKPLSKFALQTAEEIGPVNVDVGNTSCQVPVASDCIRKLEKRGAIGKKRKTVKC
jgi:hypothetical protein